MFTENNYQECLANSSVVLNSYVKFGDICIYFDYNIKYFYRANRNYS